MIVSFFFLEKEMTIAKEADVKRVLWKVEREVE